MTNESISTERLPANISSVREHYNAGTITAEDIVWLMEVANKAVQDYDPKPAYEAALVAAMEYGTHQMKSVRAEVDAEKTINLTLRERILELERKIINLEREASGRA